MRTTLLAVRLTLRTPGGVTAPERTVVDERTDADGEVRVRNLLPLRRDPDGRLAIPGSTVAGGLRDHCAADPALAPLFGSAPASELVASTIRVLGSVVLDRPVPDTRTRTAIDRGRGAAANRTLHAVEQLPAGTRFDIVLRWDDPDAEVLAGCWPRSSTRCCAGPRPSAAAPASGRVAARSPGSPAPITTSARSRASPPGSPSPRTTRRRTRSPNR